LHSKRENSAEAVVNSNDIKKGEVVAIEMLKSMEGVEFIAMVHCSRR